MEIRKADAFPNGPMDEAQSAVASDQGTENMLVCLGRTLKNVLLEYSVLNL